MAEKRVDMIQQIDYSIMMWIQENMRTDGMDVFMKFMTALGDWLGLWVFVLIIYYLLKKDKSSALQLALSLLVSMLLNQVLLKNIVRRPRPFITYEHLKPLIEGPASFSFPSSHSASSFAFAAAIATERHWLRSASFVIASLIAFSRVYLNVHYPSDIIIGSFVGVMSFHIVHKFCR